VGSKIISFIGGSKHLMISNKYDCLV